MQIAQLFSTYTHVGFDTAPFIYYVENQSTYADKLDVIFQIIEEKSIQISTSVLTLIETLTKPIQQSDHQLIQIYREFLTQTDNIHLVAIDSQLAEKASFIRAKYNLRTPDAIQIATAIQSKCDAFLTNDKGFKRVTELNVLMLDDLVL